jgi:hypothetical protein
MDSKFSENAVPSVLSVVKLSQLCEKFLQFLCVVLCTSMPLQQNQGLQQLFRSLAIQLHDQGDEVAP